MNRKLAKLFQIGIILFGVCTLALMLWEPHIEGRNEHATLFEIYFEDAFLAYAYLGSLPFFIALYHAFKAFEFAGENRLICHESVKALKTIKNCALVLFVFVIGALVILFHEFHESDDRAGGVFIGLLISMGSIMIATTAAIFERRFKKALKSE